MGTVRGFYCDDRLTPAQDRNDPYLRVQSITIYVRDLDRSVRFYVDQLGFDLVFDARLQSGRRWVAVTPPDGTANLTLVAPEPESQEYKLIGRHSQVTFVTDDVAAKFQQWHQRGVRFQYAPRLKRLKNHVRVVNPYPADSPVPGTEPAPLWGGVFTRFIDPDGNSFGLVSFDELSRQIEAQRRATAERLESERRAAQELEIARQVQARLFPQTLPPLKTLDYAGICIQARQVGGDYYDFIDLGRHRLGLVVGDIAGKGIAAALLMASLHASLRTQRTIALGHPERLLRAVNQFFYENTPDTAYATLFFAEYIDELRRLRYANCGHLSALLLRTDRILERLDSTASVLGLFPDWDCTLGECRMSPGDILALYTDGITESFNQAGEEYGEDRLVNVLWQNREIPSQALLASVVNNVRRFSPQEQHDDITLIIAKCRDTSVGHSG